MHPTSSMMRPTRSAHVQSHSRLLMERQASRELQSARSMQISEMRQYIRPLGGYVDPSGSAMQIQPEQRPFSPPVPVLDRNFRISHQQPVQSPPQQLGGRYPSPNGRSTSNKNKSPHRRSAK